METVITGAAFGASLVASSMAQPHLIASQFSLQQWDMAQTFLTATGSSALAVELLRQLNYITPQPRSWSSTGLFSSAIDGNIIGGLLLGAGMALSSSCPGMALPQLALGISSAPATIAGACAGGVLWSALLRPCIARQRSRRRRRRRTPPPLPPTSFAQALGLGHTTAFLLYEAVLVLMVSALRTRTLAPVAGGLLIGGAQLVSLLLRRGSLLGVSTCFEQLGDWAVYMAKVCLGGGGRSRAAFASASLSSSASSRPGTSAMLFAAAMVGGAWALVAIRPDFLLAPRIVSRGGGGGGGGSGPSTGRALAGGALMAVGSRLAGGCACGHGISGLALMSMSSLVTMVAAFGAAILMSR